MANLIVESGSSMTLSAGNSAGPVYVQGGGQLIVNGGAASEVAVQNMGNATVLGGGVMNTINAAGGLVNVLSGGLANNTILTDDANMNVRSAGKANNVNVLDGVLAVSSGGYASGVQISTNGALKMTQGASAAAITLSAGGTIGGFTQISGVAAIAAMNGNAIAGTVTGLNATGNISAVKGAVISGGTFASGTIQFMGGTASGLTIANSGVLKANSADVTVSSTCITSGGTLLLTGTAVADGITIYAGGTVNNFTHIGNTAATITKMTGNTITGNASNIVFEGTMNVGKGVTMTNITVADGVFFLASGAKVEGLVISAGSAAIQNGAAGNGITVCDGAYLRIQAGGSATNVTLANGAKALDFQQVGTSAATIGMINNNGVGGTIANLNATGDVNILTGAAATALTAAADGKITLNAGAKANTVSIASAGTLTVQSGATAQNVAVAAGGHLNIVSGGSAVSVDLTNRGYLDMVIGSGDSKTYVTGKNEKGTFSYINGVASNFVVYTGQNLVITSGGSARNLTVAQGGVLSAAMGADITGYSSDMRMSFSIQDGAISGLTNLYNFELGIGHGYAVDGQKLYNGGVQSVGSGGLVNRTTINAGGEVRVGYNGSAWDLNQSAGGKISLDVYQSGALTSVTGSRTDSNGVKQIFGLDNGIATNFVISSGAYLNIHSGGSAEKTTVVEGGKLVLSSGGTATKITLEQNAILSADVYGNDSKTVFEATRDSASMYMSNGVANGFVLENGGRLNVRNGGTASNTTIGNNGLLYVDYMGSAANVNIENGGNVYVQNAARIASVNIQDGAQLTLAAGAIVEGSITVDGLLTLEGTVTCLGATITIDLTDDSNAGAPLIENLSFMTGATYALKINTFTVGDYIIASGVLNFTGSVELYDNESKYLGTLENNTLKLNDTSYTLVEENGNLILSVDAAGELDKYAVEYTIGKINGVSCVFETRNDGTAVIRSVAGVNDVQGSINAAEWTFLDVGDFDGDGNDGMLWLENATGYVYMQNNALNFNEINNKSNCLGVLGDGYTILGTGDFTGTGMDGLIMQGPAFGDASVSLNYGLPVWGREADGTTFAGWLGALVNTWQEGDALKGDINDLADINAKNYAYEVVAVGDFNGDGVDDVMLQNVMPGTVDGVAITGSGDVFTFLTGDIDAVKAGEAPTVAYAGCATDGWNIICTGDFDGDGIDDVLLSDGTSIAGWKMANGQRVDNMWFGNLDPNQSIVDVGDFNGDGTDDILIHNSISGELSTWFVENGTINGFSAIA